MLKNVFKGVLMLCMVFMAAFFLVKAVNIPETEIQTNDISNSAVSADEISTIEEPEPAVYIIAEHEGYIAVFYGQIQGDPLIVTSISTGLLRAVDRELLEQGIAVSSIEEVFKLLEDFNS